MIAAEDAEVLSVLLRCAAVGPFFVVGVPEHLDVGHDGDGRVPPMAGDGPSWRAGAALLAPTDPLAAAIGQVRRWASDTHPRVAASLFFMSYTGRLLSTAVAGVLLGGVLVDLRAHRLSWRYRPGHGVELRLAAVAGWRPAPGQSCGVLLPALGDVLVGGQLARTVHAIGALVPVSARLLWGNVASSLAGALIALAAAGAVREQECLAAGEALMRTPRLHGTGEFRALAGGGLGFRRRSCCLYYRLPDAAGVCADCVLTGRPR